MNDLIFEGKGIRKTFGPTVALKEVDILIKRGEIRGLIGENGSGKSTVMSIAAGMQDPTAGEMYYKGEEWTPKNMIEAQQSGVSMILQEANTIPGVTVAQNIFAGRESEFSRFGIINMKRMFKEAKAILNKFGISHIRVEDPIQLYGFEDRKLIEIARSVSENTEMLIIDETTTALSLEGRKILYSIMKKLAREQKAVVFISHDMDEILEQCNTLTVLRDGEIIGHISEDEMKQVGIQQKIRYMMVGREIGDKYYREDYEASHLDEMALKLDQIEFGMIRDFSLTVRKGEIIGIGGLSGCGMHEVGRAAFGLEKLRKGTVYRGNHKIDNCLEAINKGIGYVSKNRDSEALILNASIMENIVLPSLNDLEKGTYISPEKEKRLARTEIDVFRIKSNDENQWVNTLSGGNKQKVSFAKWTAKGADVLILDCPTRGVDIGVKQAMYSLIEQMKKDGKAILMISEELPELIGMSDRVIVMKDFKISKEFVRSSSLKETDIIEYMI